MADREPRRTSPVMEALRRHARVEAVGGALATLAGPGARAMLLYPPGLGFVVAFFACLRAGLVAVPAPLPRKHGNRQFAALLRDAAPALVLSTREVSSQFAAAPGVPRTAVALIQYTSGSTSAPRGVEVSHANLAANVEAIGEAFGFHRDSVMVSWLPPFHDMGLVGSLVAPAALGFRSVLMAPATSLRHPLRWLEAIAAYGATCAGAPDFAWDLCARRWQAGPREPLDLSRLELAYNGPSRCAPPPCAACSQPSRAAACDRKHCSPATAWPSTPCWSQVERPAARRTS